MLFNNLSNGKKEKAIVEILKEVVKFTYIHIQNLDAASVAVKILTQVVTRLTVHIASVRSVGTIRSMVTAFAKDVTIAGNT